MPLYHVQHPTAIDFPDARSAERHAERLAGGLTALSKGLGGERLRDWHVEVSDESGTTLGRYDLRKATRLGNTLGRAAAVTRLGSRAHAARAPQNGWNPSVCDRSHTG